MLLGHYGRDVVLHPSLGNGHFEEISKNLGQKGQFGNLVVRVELVLNEAFQARDDPWKIGKGRQGA